MSTVKVCDHCGATNRDTGRNFAINDISCMATLTIYDVLGGIRSFHVLHNRKDLHLCPQCRALLMNYLNGFFRLKHEAEGLVFVDAEDKEDSNEQTEKCGES